MSAFKGTKGEWYTPDEEYPYGRDVRARIGERDVWLFSAHGSHGHGGSGGFPSDEECAANALLGAAARDLLEALEIVEAALRKDSRQKSIVGDEVEYHLDGNTMYHAINTARAAIARATQAPGGEGK